MFKFINQTFKDQVFDGQFSDVRKLDIKSSNSKVRLVRSKASKDGADTFCKQYMTHFDKKQRCVATVPDHPIEVSILDALKNGLKCRYVPSILSVGKNYVELPYYSKGSLADVDDNNPITLETVSVIGYQISNALMNAQRYLKIIHFDVKPANILVENDHTYLMGDWGSSVGMQSYDSRYIKLPVMTTAFYRDPYVMLNPIDTDLYPYHPNADVWSLGITLLELFLNKRYILGSIVRTSPLLRFAKMNMLENQLLSNIFYFCGVTTDENGHFVEYDDPDLRQKYLREHLLKDVDSEFADLICGMLRFNPADRLSIEDVHIHPFFYKHYLNEPIVSSTITRNYLPNDGQRFIRSNKSPHLQTAIKLAIDYEKPTFLPVIVFKVIHLLRYIANETNFCMVNWDYPGRIEDFVRSIYNLVLSIHDCNVIEFTNSGFFQKIELVELVGSELYFSTEYEYMVAEIHSTRISVDYAIDRAKNFILSKLSGDYLYSEMRDDIFKTFKDANDPDVDQLCQLKQAKENMPEPLLKKKRKN